jgi:hypothetical protein
MTCPALRVGRNQASRVLGEKDKDGSGFGKAERRAAPAVPIDDGPRFFIAMLLSAAIIPRAFLN